MSDRRRRGARAKLGHNGGPPLDEDHESEWGRHGFARYFEWRSAHRRAFKVAPEIMTRRAEKAEALGLTYEEYTLEILERGVYLQAEDEAAIAAIKARRRRRRR